MRYAASERVDVGCRSVGLIALDGAESEHEHCPYHCDGRGESPPRDWAAKARVQQQPLDEGDGEEAPRSQQRDENKRRGGEGQVAAASRLARLQRTARFANAAYLIASTPHTT